MAGVGAAAGALELLALLEQRMDEVGRRYVEELQSQMAEYREADPELLRQSEQSARGIIVTSIEAVRSGTAKLSPELRAGLRQLARVRAENGFPLHASIRSFGIGRRVMWDVLTAAAREEGKLDADGLATLLEIGNEIHSTVVADFTNSYLAAQATAQDRSADLASNLLVDLVEARNPETLELRAAALGLRTDAAYTVVGAALGKAGEVPDATTRQAVARTLAQSVEGDAVWGVVGHVLVVAAVASADVEVAATVLLAVAASYSAAPAAVAVARTHVGLDGLRDGITEVNDVLSLAGRVGLRGVLHPNDVVVPRLLAASPEVARQLGCLLDSFDSLRNGPALLATLDAFLDCECNAVRTADRLFLHRNSLRYRLSRIEALLGMPIIPNRVLLRLALVSRQLDARGAVTAASA